MESYEYRVIPAPRRYGRVKGARTASEKFATTVAQVINAEAAEGWEYLRADTLPLIEKRGLLASSAETLQTVLVFRRPRNTAPAAEVQPQRRRGWRARGAAAADDPMPGMPAERPEPEPPLRADEPRRDAEEPPLRRREGAEPREDDDEPVLRPADLRPMSEGPARPFGAPRRRDR